MSEQHTSIPAQHLIQAGPFRANSRAQITVESDALDLITITVRAGDFTTTTVLAGDHLDAFATVIRRAQAARRRALKAVA